MKIVENMQPIWDGLATKLRAEVGYVEGGYIPDPTITVNFVESFPFLDPHNYSDRGFLPEPNLVVPLQYDVAIKKGIPVRIDFGFDLEDVPEGCIIEIMMRSDFAEQKGIYLRGGTKLVNPKLTTNLHAVVMYDGAGTPIQQIARLEDIAWASEGSETQEQTLLTRGSCPFIIVIRPVISVLPVRPVPIPIPVESDDPVEDTKLPKEPTEE